MGGIHRLSDLRDENEPFMLRLTPQAIEASPTARVNERIAGMEHGEFGERKILIRVVTSQWQSVHERPWGVIGATAR